MLNPECLRYGRQHVRAESCQDSKDPRMNQNRLTTQTVRNAKLFCTFFRGIGCTLGVQSGTYALVTPKPRSEKATKTDVNGRIAKFQAISNLALNLDLKFQGNTASTL